MIAVAAPDDRVIARCTQGYAWQLAMHVYREGWTWWNNELLFALTTRIALWHDRGLSGVWS